MVLVFSYLYLKDGFCISMNINEYKQMEKFLVHSLTWPQGQGGLGETNGISQWAGNNTAWDDGVGHFVRTHHSGNSHKHALKTKCTHLHILGSHQYTYMHSVSHLQSKVYY